MEKLALDAGKPLNEVGHSCFPSPGGGQDQVANATRFPFAAFGASQPSAGATVFAMSSIERRIRAWGGSTEWTWKTRSVTRSSVLSARKRRNHVVGRSDMHVERRDQLRQRPSGGDKSDVDEMIDDPAQADIRKAQRFFPVVRDEQGSGRHDARLAPWLKRREIGVDDRMLEVRERRVPAPLSVAAGCETA